MVPCRRKQRQENIRLQSGDLLRQAMHPWHSGGMAISARNQLEGKVVEVTLGDIMAHVVVKVGKNQIESVITRRSAEQLKLKKGDKIVVVIKSTEVMLQKD
jgi:molybdopterin-binding protein